MSWLAPAACMSVHWPGTAALLDRRLPVPAPRSASILADFRFSPEIISVAIRSDNKS
jgi:hypothetical protein